MTDINRTVLSAVAFVLLSLTCGRIRAELLNQADILTVTVYYEALCVDSMRFIRYQLYPTLKHNNWLQYVDLQLIPYGKVSTWTNHETNITSLYCQHGNVECELNALHACIVEHNSMVDQLEMVNCLMRGFYTNVDQCSNSLNVDVRDAKHCKESRSTREILEKYGQQTNMIDLTFVPSIGLDGVFTPSQQNDILYHFELVLCREYKEKFNRVLDLCKDQNI